ncbi:glycosyltransferase [Leifsonia sp. AK011]|uniref:glycosyltransferase n=1 Tax=Leifsonia sp. AK011 TaxID=2723075 RepID=UPI00211C3405|nr:glycosyltransferase [Leifsonia sp. AK011]
MLDGLSICLAGINYAPDSTGIAPYNTAMAEALRDAGADVHVVTGIPHYPEWRVKDEHYLKGSRWDEVIEGVKVTRLRHHVPPRSNLAGRARMEASFLARAMTTIRRDRSDVVIAVTPSMSALGAGVYGKKGRPLGVLVQDLTGNAAGESGTTGRGASRWIAGYEYSLVRSADLVGVITPQFGSVLAANGIEPERVVEIPNFTHITPSASTKSSARRELGWPEDQFLVVHTGNMGMKQGLDSVIEAAGISAKNNLGVTFVLVGDGNQRADLEARAGDLSTLRFVDPLGAKEYPLALAAADALLLNERPGVREMSLPSKLTSYTSATRPIIAATEPGGITHSVVTSDRAAIVIAPGDPFALTEAALALSTDAPRAAIFAASARAMHESRYAPTQAKARYVAFAKRLGGLA